MYICLVPFCSDASTRCRETVCSVTCRVKRVLDSSCPRGMARIFHAALTAPCNPGRTLKEEENAHDACPRLPVLATPGRHSDRPPCLLLACVLVRVSVFPFKITPSSPVMSQCTRAHKKFPHVPPLHHSRAAVIVNVREHWQVWAQLCFSLSGACRAPGIQEWPGAAAAVTPGISFPDKPARDGERKCGGCRVPPACR